MIGETSTASPTDHHRKWLFANGDNASGPSWHLIGVMPIPAKRKTAFWAARRHFSTWEECVDMAQCSCCKLQRKGQLSEIRLTSARAQMSPQVRSVVNLMVTSAIRDPEHRNRGSGPPVRPSPDDTTLGVRSRHPG